MSSPQEPTSHDAGKRLFGNSFWIASSETIKTVVTLASSLIAARVLSKGDFGLMGVVMLTFSILNTFTQTGIEQALIQYQGDDVKKFMNVAWTWQVLRGVGLTALMMAAAPFLAWWYEAPLTWLLMFSALRMLFLGVQNNGTLLFKRNLDFKKVFLINVLQVSVSVVVVIPCLLLLRNVWALVIGTLVDALATLAISYWSHPFRPKFQWDTEKFKYLMGYGRWLAGLTILLFIITQGDDIFVSKFFGIEALGLYQMAYTLSNTPATKIAHVLSQVGFPSYARLQDQPEALREAFRQVMRASVLLSGMLSVLLATYIPEVVTYVISPKWAPIIPLVQILVVSAFIRSIAALAGSLFRACGKPDWDLKMNLPRFFILVVGILPASMWGGLEAVCAVVVCAIASCLPMWCIGVKSLLGMGPVAVLRDNGLAWANMCVMAACLWGGKQCLSGSWYETLGGMSVGVCAWLVVMWGLGKIWPRLNLYGEAARLKASIMSLRRPASEAA